MPKDKKAPPPKAEDKKPAFRRERKKPANMDRFYDRMMHQHPAVAAQKLNRLLKGQKMNYGGSQG